MTFLGKRITAAILLTSFIMIAVFGFTMMMHMADGQEAYDCPFTPMGQSLCPQNVAAVAVHHIAAYQSFLSVYVNANLTVILLSLIFTIFIGLAIFVQYLFFDRQIFAYLRNNDPPLAFKPTKLSRWLSLFEHSPSF